MLPTSTIPDEIDPAWADRLTRIYGGESWRDLYEESHQEELFGPPKEERTTGVDGLLEIYKKNLRRVFGDRFLERSRTLRRNNSPLFELIFCVGNPKGIGPAKRIAQHILDHI